MLLHEQFVRMARSKGDKLAFIDRSTGRRLSYRRTLIASLILRRKVGAFSDGYIGIMVPTSAGCGLAILATLMAGKVPVMINYSTGAESNVRYAQERCGFATVLTSRKVLEKVGCPEVEGMVFLEDMLESVTVVNKLAAAAQAALPLPLLRQTFYTGSEDDTAIILFTSGSEKAPKGVELTHRNLYSNVMATNDVFVFTDEDIIMAVLPLFHVFGQMTNLWLPLTLGLTVVTYGNPLEFRNVVTIIREERPTMLVGTPFFLGGYLKQSGPGDFESVRLLVAGADKTPDSLRTAYREQHGIEIVEGYGTTETSPVISANRPDNNRPGSVGLPLPGVQVRIADVRTGEDLPAGHEGKILVKGDLVMKGYFDDIEETALHIEGGWYETGDMGLLDDDGFLWHRGRLKRFVKIGGEMVSLVRVETALEQLLPDAVECCVVEIPDARKGATIAVAVTQPVDEKRILAGLAKELPPIALPRRFVVMEELPKMGSGKIDFRQTTVLVQRRLAGDEA